jgi:hypothetical protein
VLCPLQISLIRLVKLEIKSQKKERQKSEEFMPCNSASKESFVSMLFTSTDDGERKRK